MMKSGKWLELIGRPRHSAGNNEKIWGKPTCSSGLKTIYLYIQLQSQMGGSKCSMNLTGVSDVGNSNHSLKNEIKNKIEHR